MTLLTIVREVESEPRKDGRLERYVLVRCQCGTERVVALRSVARGNTRSCGVGSCYRTIAIPRGAGRYPRGASSRQPQGPTLLDVYWAGGW